MNYTSKGAATALLAAMSIAGTASPAAASIVGKPAAVVQLDENGMIAIAGIEADAALTAMYDQSPAEVFEYAMDVNGIHCTTNNNAGCNTVAGCGGTFV